MAMNIGRIGIRCLLVFALSVLAIASSAVAATSTATTLAITSSGGAVTTVASGSVVTLTASVNAGTAAVTTGQVNFCDAAAASCTDIHLLATAQLTSAGTAVFKFVPGIGNHSYKAVFAGTKSYATSSTSTSTLTVTSATVTYSTTTALVSSGSVGDYSLTATIAGSGTFASPAPGGTVSFLDTNDGNSVIGTADLAAGTSVLSFSSPSSPTVGGSPGFIVSADLNGDGKPDLAVYDEISSQVTILLGDGAGSFTAAAPLTAPFGDFTIAAADFNADGKIDLVLAGSVNGTDGFVTVFPGNGDGTFAAAKTYAMQGAFPTAIAIADFNQDGIPDVAALTASSGVGSVIAILLGNGDGTFTAAASQPDVVGLATLAVGDFNGDGKADLAVVVNSGTEETLTFTATVLLGNGDGTFTAAASSSACCEPAGLLVVGDFNGDGKADLAVADDSYYGLIPTGAAITVMLGNGDGTFAANPQQFPAGQDSASSISIGDFNGDGNADLATSSPGIPEGTNPTILLGNGSGTFASASFAAEYSGGYTAVADFSGDGISDIALSGTSLTTIAILVPQQQQTSSAAATGISPIGSGTHQIVASYPGDSNYNPSVSQPVDLTAVAPNAPITFNVPSHIYGNPPFTVAATSISTGAFTYSVVSGPASLSGTTVTLTGVGTVTLKASQAAAGYYPAASQLAVFTVNQAVLTITTNSAARVFGAPNPTFSGTITGALNGDTFTETYTTTATAASIVGSYPIVASVTGADIGNYIVSATNGALTVSQAGTATTFALSNENTTLTATVVSLTSGQPTGSVAFYEGQTQVGSGALSNGTASYTASTLPSGDVVVSAQYSGDANFTQSASPPILVLSVVPANTSLTVAQAGSVTDTVNLSPAPGYMGTVQLSCSGVPQNASCSFEPASVVFSGTNNAASVSVTIQTGVGSQTRLQPSLPTGDGSPRGILAAVIWIPGLFTTICIGRRRTPFEPRKRQRLLLCFLLCSFGTILGGCGSASSTINPSATVTPAGTYAIQVVVSGSSGLAQTANLSLVVH